jgi:hypothetical protein
VVVWPATNTQVVGGFPLVSVLEYAARDPGGAFAVQQPLDTRPNRDASAPQVAIGRRGEPIVVWQRSTGVICQGRPMPTCYPRDERPVVAIGASPGRAPKALASAGFGPSVAATPRGAIVAWSGPSVAATDVDAPNAPR